MTDRRAAGPPPAAAPDAEVFRLAAAWFSMHRALDQIDSSDEECYEPLSAQYTEALRDLLRIVPTTIAGLDAKAAVLVAQIRLTCSENAHRVSVAEELEPHPPIGPDLLGHIDLHNLLWYLRRDIAALAQRERCRSPRSEKSRGFGNPRAGRAVEDRG